MAKSNDKSKAVAVREEEPQAVAQIGGGFGLVPDFMKDYQGPTGTETIDREDITLPRLKLCQSMTPEVKDGLAQDGDFMHNITQEVMCPRGQRIKIIPIAASKQYLLWRDRKDGGGIMARASRVVLPPLQPGLHERVFYAWDKANTEFETKIDGKIPVKYRTKTFIEQDGLHQFGTQIPNTVDSPPAATAHHNFVVVLPEHGYMMVAISLARTAAPRAKDLNYLMKQGSMPIWGRVIDMMSIEETRDDNKFYNYRFAPAGLVQDRQVFEQLRQLHMDLRDKGVNVDFSDEENRVYAEAEKQADQKLKQAGKF